MNNPLRKLFGLPRPCRIAAALAILMLMHFLFPRYVIASDSMAPTIRKGDYVVAFRWGYCFSKPEPGDIVVFGPAEKISEAPWMHRILAVPGERIDQIIYARPFDSYRDLSGFGANRANERTSVPSIVPQGFVYQAGDSRTSYHGLVPVALIRAKVLFYVHLGFPEGK